MIFSIIQHLRPDEITEQTPDIFERGPVLRMTQHSPRRFKLTITYDSLLNHCLYIDVVSTKDRKCLHVVDAPKRYQDTKLLSNAKYAAIWNHLRAYWLDFYLGLPDIMRHDDGSNHICRKFVSNCAMLHIRMDSVLKDNSSVNENCAALSCPLASCVRRHG